MGISIGLVDVAIGVRGDGQGEVGRAFAGGEIEVVQRDKPWQRRDGGSKGADLVVAAAHDDGDRQFDIGRRGD